MPGTFIISFDCEGKWGMADGITEHHNRVITRDALVRAYERLIALLDLYQMPATFAFVMAFVLTGEERHLLSDSFGDVTVEDQNWMRHYREAEACGVLDGWFCPEALELVRARPQHEVGCHGFRHIPLAAVARDEVMRELAAASKVAAIKQLKLETFIFPRNQVGHLDALASHGYVGYRAAPKAARNGRVTNLAREFNVFGRAQETPVPNRMVPIPSGYFLNWRSGLRRLVPPRATDLRWKSILEDAVRRDRVAHLWLHPHNIIDGPATFESLERVLAHVALLQGRRGLQVLTQATYCRQLLKMAGHARHASQRSEWPATSAVTTALGH
jgi:peptidoglycan/xylan/chitin deacetylase (PgdA/CDA1 family)